MQRISLLLACLACAGQGRRVQHSNADSERPLRSERVLEKLSPAAAFNPSGAGVHSALANPTSSAPRPTLVDRRSSVGHGVVSDRRTPRGQRAPWVNMQDEPFESGRSCTKERVVIVGATGYIGKYVVRESVRRGYETVAVVRDKARAEGESKFEGATIIEADVTDPESLAQSGAFEKGSVDVVISCLASRTGMKKDAYAIDYQATLNALDIARANGARHFVLLSAYCVAKPWLQFQFAKLKFEEALQKQTDMTYSIVRPTAFFKSVSGQLEVVEQGGPFVYFDLGGGKTMTCNPIAEADLAVAMIDTIADPAKVNSIWNLGGPDAGLNMETQGKMVAKAVERENPFLLGVPIGIFDFIINGLQWVADTFQSEKFDDAAEFGRIGKYYAVEDMLTTDPSEKFGSITLEQHYNRIAKEGQEYDPYTTMFGKAGGVRKAAAEAREEQTSS